MKKVIYSLCVLAFAFSVKAQVSSEPAGDINPEDSLKIIVNLEGLDPTAELTALMDAVDNGEDMYIWTWQPNEHPAGHPLNNGTWTNSNDTLVMTKEDALGSYVFSFSMIPTDFYEVPAGDVYSKDISFLVKAKDGSGSPERKTGDLKVAVDPPSTVRNPVYGFPSNIAEDDVLTVVYENARETKASMQNLDPDSAYIHAECKLISGTVVKVPTSYFDDLTMYPDAKMTLVDAESNTFNLYMLPRQYFGLAETAEIDEIKIIVRKPVWQGGEERVDDDLIIVVKCP